MTGLDGKAHRLVELARGGDEPSASQLLSLHGAVSARIAAAGAMAAAATTTGKAASASLLVKGLVAAGAIATGAAGFFALEDEPPAPAAVVSARAPAVAPAPALKPASSPAAPSPEISAAPPPTRQGRPTANLRLQDEAALLAEVQGALRSGQAATALSQLERYDRRFPQGMLRSEAEAARVFALCAAGKADKARAAAQRFVQRYPNAPATARVQSACK